MDLTTSRLSISEVGSLSITDNLVRPAAGSGQSIEYGTGTRGPESARNEDEDEDEDEDEIQKYALNGYVDNYPTVPAQKASIPVKFDNRRLKPGESVAIKDGAEPVFMRIRDVYTKPNGQLFIRGLKLVQRGNPLTLLEHVAGELVVVIQAPDIPDVEHCAAAASRYVDIIFTNQNYNNLNWSQLSMPRPTRSSYNNVLSQIYFCRWKCFLPPVAHVFPESSSPETLSRHPSGLIVRLAEDEVDDGDWGSERFGIKEPSKVQDHMLRGQSQQDVISRRIHGKYTFGDAFAGAGGTSLGAYHAGLALTWAFDIDDYATQTYRKNFEQTGVTILKQHVGVFMEQVQRVKRNGGTYYVDILHLSPPCQPYSCANNMPNEMRDARNFDVFDKMPEEVKVIQPRIITLEEVFAFESHERNRKAFRKLISMFVELGYSTSWRIMHLWQYGVPQTRTRLIMIAAAPGEKLPPFPAPTHQHPLYSSDPPSDLPSVCIDSAIANLDTNDPDHDLKKAYRFAEPQSTRNRKGLSHTILTSGSSQKGPHHPSGRRHYTVRELACLQTFPVSFKFMGPPEEQKRQIDNAVPPAAAQVLFSKIKRFLEMCDEKEREIAGNFNG